ncbi:MAG: DNA polymerase III subunit beta [Taibaiella sp.]|jgi:DNA polymerase III beta subunit
MNNIIISNDVLKKTLKRVKDVIDKKSHLPVLQNVLIKAKHKTVDFIVSDLEVTAIVRMDLDADNETEFDVLLPFELLNSICNLSGSCPMQISSDGTQAMIAANSDKYEVNALEEVSEYPALADFPESDLMKLNDDFVFWMDRSLLTLSPDKLRPAMTKVCLDIKASELTIVTTDALCMFTKGFKLEECDDAILVLSPKVVKVLSGLENIGMSWNENHVKFQDEGITIIAQRCLEKFPPFRNVIPKKSKPNVEFNRQDIIAALEKVSITAGSASAIQFLLKSMIGVVKVESNDANCGRSSSTELAADFSGTCECIGVNVKNMINVLKQVHFDYISLAIDQPSKPIILSAKSDETYQGLIMPLLLS